MFSVSCSIGGGGVRIPETGATLEGTVKYGSEPVKAALIIVKNQSGEATGMIDEETGRYKVENVPLGEVNIAVNTEAAKGQMMGKMMSGYYKGPEAKAKGITSPPKILEVPAKYGVRSRRESRRRSPKERIRTTSRSRGEFRHSIGRRRGAARACGPG
jgi:hypothetical protein